MNRQLRPNNNITVRFCSGTTTTNEGSDFKTEVDDEEPEVVDEGPSGAVEHGGPKRGGKYREPTRFGDWEQKGRCSDF